MESGVLIYPFQRGFFFSKRKWKIVKKFDLL